MMTSKSDPRGHPGLKLCVHVSVMGYYRFINFHQNRRGSGIFLGDFTWNDSYVMQGCRAGTGAAGTICSGPKSESDIKSGAATAPRKVVSNSYI